MIGSWFPEVRSGVNRRGAHPGCKGGRRTMAMIEAGGDGQWVDDGQQPARDRATQVVCWAMVLAAAGLALVPGLNPIVMALVALGPWALVFVVFVGNGRYALIGPDGQTVMNGVMIVPVILFFHAVLTCHMVDVRAMMAPAAGLWAGFCLLAFIAHLASHAARPSMPPPPPKRRSQWLAIPIGAGMLAWAMLVDVNAGAAELIDSLAPGRLPAEYHGVIVARKWVSSGRSHTHYVELADAPPIGIAHFEVSRALYDSTREGDRLCLVIHPGALGWRWYDLAEGPTCNDPISGHGPA